MPRIMSMKRFILLLLLIQCSFANELSLAQHKAELASLELMAEIKAEMAVKIFELPPVEVCVWPDDKLIFSNYHSSLRTILNGYQNI
jgi:hypothetical protein